MSIDHTIPPLRDLPAGRLDARKEHLVAEIERTPQHPSVLWVPGWVGSRRRIAALALVVALVVVGTAVAATTDWLTGASERRDAVESASRAITYSVTQTIDGKTWRAGRFTIADGSICREIRSPQGWKAVNCLPPERMRDPIEALSGSTPGVNYIYGSVSAEVTDLSVVLDDCTSRRVPSRDGVFLFVLPSSRGDASPSELIARSTSGQILQSLALAGHSGTSASRC